MNMELQLHQMQVEMQYLVMYLMQTAALLQYILSKLHQMVTTNLVLKYKTLQ